MIPGASGVCLFCTLLLSVRGLQQISDLTTASGDQRLQVTSDGQVQEENGERERDLQHMNTLSRLGKIPSGASSEPVLAPVAPAEVPYPDLASVFHIPSVSEAIGDIKQGVKEIETYVGGAKAPSHAQVRTLSHKPIVWFPYESEQRDTQKKCDPPILGATETAIDFPVDIVYTWIAQPSQDDFAHIMEDCPHLAGSWQRFRNMHTLRFSLRMLEQNLPWVRRVFIVTGRDAPSWLNTSSPRVQVIKQEDLWPQGRLKGDLPIHNSQSVEVHLHRIPGLATHFVYFNDDMFVGRPLERSFFFSDEGTPVMHAGSVASDVGWCHRDVPGSLQVNSNTHECIALTIPMIVDAQARWPAAFANISASHCRGDLPADKGPTWHYAWYGIQSGLTDLRSEATVAWLSRHTKDPHDWYNLQLRQPPDMGCINDDFTVDDAGAYHEQMTELIGFLKTYSHGKTSKFELHDHWGL